MPIASGLGFVEREHPPLPRREVRNADAPPAPEGPRDAPAPRERLVCGLLLTAVVAGSLATLLWFVATVE